MKKKAQSYRKTVVVDTNALHYMRTYLICAKTNQFPPFGEYHLWPDIKSKLEQKAPVSYYENLHKGYKILGYLQKLSEEDVQILFSVFTELELLHGLLDGKAHIKMSEGGTPYRMRQRLSDLSRLVAFHLHPEDCVQVAKELEEMTQEFNKVGVHLDLAQADRHLREIIAICNVVQRAVFIEPFDCLIYGNALILMAESIISADGYFRDVINRIANPKVESNIEQRKLWKEANAQIKKKLADIIQAPEKSFSLPESPGMPKNSVVLGINHGKSF